MGRREEKREATRQEILSAAADLFKTKGYESTSVDDIALAADVAKGTFYYHFKAKEDLVHALQDAELNSAEIRVEERLKAGESPLTILLDFLKHAAHWAEANPDLERAIFRKKIEMMSQGPPSCQSDDNSAPPSKKHFIKVIVDLLEAAQERGEIRKDLPAEDLTRVIIPVVMSTRMHWLMDPKESLAERIEKSFKLVIEGFKGQ
ncbi:MAG: TetR family transcriptional regulator [Candidatus Obscuribacterales bacterium]